MYTYSKELEDRLLAELHNHYNTGISFLPGIVASEREPSGALPEDFTFDFEETLIRLLVYTASMLDGNCFPCMVNDAEEQNAFAERRHGIQIVGLHLPLVAECLSLAHAFSMFDDFFEVNRPITRFDYEYNSPTINPDGSFSMETAKSKEKQSLADVTAFLAVKFVLLHEVAHHHYNHLDRTRTGRLSAKSDTSCVLDGFSLQELETEADIWATAQLISDFEDIKESLAQNYSSELSNLDAIKIIYLAATIPLLTAYEKITPENFTQVDHPPAIFRYNDIKEAFVSAFGVRDSIDRKYWGLVKDELLVEYEKYEWMAEDFELTLDKFEIPRQGVDILEEVKADNPEYVRCFLSSWMGDVFAYVTIRFAEMTGEGFRSTYTHFKDLIARANELTADGVKIGKTVIVTTDENPPQPSENPE